MIDIKHAFGFTSEPFPQDVKVEDLYPLPGLDALLKRFFYAVRLSAISVITGDVGSGKSTSLRYATSKLHPSEFKVIPIVATTGSLLELFRQICLVFGIEYRSFSIALMTKMVRDIISEIAGRKETPVLVIDEAHLLRSEIYAQLHTLTQFEFDSKSLMPMILSGQKKLIDKLMYQSSRPLASRVVGRSYLEGLKLKDMHAYIHHHLKIAGGREGLFADEAVLAIHQGSGGLLRRANTLAKGALLAAAMEKCTVATAEHVRLASTEIM